MTPTAPRHSARNGPPTVSRTPERVERHSSMRADARVALGGALAGALNAWLCYARLPVAGMLLSRWAFRNYGSWTTTG